MNRLDLAQKKYLNFSIYDDEDLFVHLAHIYLLVFKFLHKFMNIDIKICFVSNCLLAIKT